MLYWTTRASLSSHGPLPAFSFPATINPNIVPERNPYFSSLAAFSISSRRLLAAILDSGAKLISLKKFSIWGLHTFESIILDLNVTLPGR